MPQIVMYPGMENSPQTELASAIDVVQDTVPLVDASKLPAGPNIATLGSDETAETVIYTDKTGNTLTGVTRGVEGAAKAWSAGAKVARNFTARDYDTLRQNVQDLDAGKAALASPAFTDTPTAPTPAAGDNSTRLATTAYADNADNDAALLYWMGV